MTTETPAEVLADMKARAEFDSENADELDEFRERMERSLAAGRVATLPDGYRIEVQHGDEKWMTTAYTLVTPDKRRWSPAPMEPGYYLLAALSAPPADPAKASDVQDVRWMDEACDLLSEAGHGIHASALGTLAHAIRIGRVADVAKASGSAPDVETVARKLFESEQRSRSGEWTWDECSPIEREGWTEIAQAAIEILQPAAPQASAPEVTESMIDRARKAVVCNGESVEREISVGYQGLIPAAQESMVREVLRTALTAALQEKSHG